MMSYYALEQLMNLHDGYKKSFVVAGHSLLLLDVDGRRYLISNQCPHQQASLNTATLGYDNGGSLRCSRHGMVFNLTTGVSLDGCDKSLQYYKLSYEGSTIGVDI